MQGKRTETAGVSKSARAMTFAELHDNAVRATTLLKAMANPSRLMILCQLAEGEKSVGELVEAIGSSQSGLSQHLAILRREKVVTARRMSQSILYSLASPEAEALIQTLYALFCDKEAGRPLRKLRLTVA
jgi:DNA-binding transcriptional ArsR family regulator